MARPLPPLGGPATSGGTFFAASLRQLIIILGTLKPEIQQCIVGVETKYPLPDYYEKNGTL